MTNSQTKYLPEPIRTSKECVDSLTFLEREICKALIAEKEIILVEDSSVEE